MASAVPGSTRPGTRAEGFLLFPTAIGFCGLAWAGAGLVAVQLPEADAAATRRRLLKGLGPCPEWARGAEMPGFVAQAVDGIRALLAGEPRHLRELVLDETRLTPFQRRVYALARAIDPGHTRTYGDLAEELGGKGLARAVGQAMGHNPFAPVVPCHRVLAAGDRPGGFSANGGAATKLRMLAIEGARFQGTASLFGD